MEDLGDGDEDRDDGRGDPEKSKVHDAGHNERPGPGVGLVQKWLGAALTPLRVTQEGLWLRLLVAGRLGVRVAWWSGVDMILVATAPAGTGG